MKTISKPKDVLTANGQPISRRIVSIFLFSILFFMIGCRDQSPEAVEVRIRSSETLSRVDEFCRALPRPGDFKFVTKIDGGNLSVVGIDYVYSSSMPPEKVRELYNNNMLGNGWSFDGRFDFKKENLRVSVQDAQTIGARYSIYCAEIK